MSGYWLDSFLCCFFLFSFFLFITRVMDLLRSERILACAAFEILIRRIRRLDNFFHDEESSMLFDLSYQSFVWLMVLLRKQCAKGQACIDTLYACSVVTYSEPGIYMFSIEFLSIVNRGRFSCCFLSKSSLASLWKCGAPSGRGWSFFFFLFFILFTCGRYS